MITIKKKLLAVVLSVVVGVTFIPLLGSSVYADEITADPVDVVLDADAGEDADIAADDEAAEEEDGDIVDITQEDGATVPEENTDTAEAEADSEEPADADADLTDIETDPALSEDTADLNALLATLKDASSEGFVQLMADSDIFTWSVSVSGKKATVKGTIKKPYKELVTFGGLYVDDLEYSDPVKTLFSDAFTTTVNMSNYDIGYHTLYAVFFAAKDGTNVYDAIATAQQTGNYDNILSTSRAKKKVASKITAKPNYSGKFYYVYSKYFEFYPFDFGKNQAGEKLYMEYKIKGAKKWKRSGYMQANAIKLYAEQCYKIKKLKPNKIYKTRLRYGRYVTYSKDIGGDGKSYFFGGPVRNTKTIKTGKSKKPAFKSIKVKAVKVKKHKVKHPAYWYYVGGAAFYHKAWTEKYYTYKVKVTVKLKKKPGTKGIWINGKFVKGNKKKYTVTLPGSSYSAKKPKGKKFKVGICSYQGKSFGGLSPLYQKKLKIK